MPLNCLSDSDLLSDRMDFHRLRYFIAVAEAQNFHRAAERLHVVQPALTRQIKLLEKELGFALFERAGRGVRLSEAGRVYLTDVKRALLELSRAREHARQVAEGYAGTLRISFVEIASAHGVLPDTVHAFRQTYPDVRLVLQPLDSTAQMECLREGRIDAAFLYGGNAVAEGITRRPIHSEDVVLALPATHRLATASQLYLKDLCDEPFIWNDRALHSEFGSALMSACLGQGFSPRIVQETSGSAHIVSLVAIGIGLALVPASARWRIQEGALLKRVSDLKLQFQIDLAWRSSKKSQVLACFIDLVERIANGSAARPEPDREEVCHPNSGRRTDRVSR